MSTKLPWTRLFSSQWIVDVSGMSIVEKGLYMTLVLYMYEERRPIIEDAPKLARWAGCSVRILKKTLDILLRDEKIIRLEDGRLWSLKVEEELNNCSENLEKASKTSRSKRLSERAQKAAQARWEKQKSDACDMLNDAKHDACDMLNDAKHDACDMLNDAYIYNNNINNKININNNKKNKNIILSKREIEFENLETTDLLEKPIECDDVQSEEIKTIETKQPITHKQNINLSNEANNRWQIDEAMVDKLPLRKVRKVGKQLSEIVDRMMPAYLPEKADFFKGTKKMREKQEVESILEDFKPDFQYAIDQGLTRDEALSEFKKFVRFSKANPCQNAHERNWQKAWYKWITHPEYGLVMKKHAELEMKERYAITCCKPLSDTLAKYVRNTEAINSFAT